MTQYIQVPGCIIKLILLLILNQLAHFLMIKILNIKQIFIQVILVDGDYWLNRASPWRMATLQFSADFMTLYIKLSFSKILVTLLLISTAVILMYILKNIANSFLLLTIVMLILLYILHESKKKILDL